MIVLRAGGMRWPRWIACLLSRKSHLVRRCAVSAVSEVDPLNLVETVREGLHDPDLTVWIANHFSGVTFTTSL
jgi:hypothetical protein